MTHQRAIEAGARAVKEARLRLTNGSGASLPSDALYASAVIAAYQEYLAAEGFVVVPKEPTEAMLKAGHAGEYNRPVGRYANIYHAMLAAAQEQNDARPSPEADR